MTRLLRPLLWLAGGVGAFVGFVAVGRLVDVRLRWGDLSGWLDEVTIEEALVELTRWLGMALAGYVVVVAALVLLGEVAAGARSVPLARGLQRLAGGIAVPALRRRLVEASTATAITVSAMSATASGGGVLAAPATVEQTVDVVAPDPAALVLPAGISPAEVVGFGYQPAAASLAGHGSVDTRVTVERNDTMWAIAEAHYGWCDGSLIEKIRASSGIEDPNLIFAGQTLVLPALPTPPPSPPTVGPEDATWAVHTVVYGDTFWDILTARYGGEPSTDLVWTAAEYNHLEDPSDIPVGMQITLPPLAVLLGEAAPPEPPIASIPEAAPTPVEPAPVVPAAPSEASRTTVEAAGSPLDAEVPAPIAPERRRQSAPTDPPPEAPVSTTSVSAPADGGAAAVPPWLAAAAGATTLSVGLLAVYRRLRRRQGAAGARAWRLMPSGESARLHSQLVAAADLPLIRWASQELSAVMFGLAGPPAAAPLAVELSDLAGVEVLWDAPMLTAPAPWEATSGGWSWRLLYDPLAEVPAADLPLAVPGLVTLGRRSDASVLVDLEAYGSLSLGGDARAAEDLMRAIVLELGTGEELSNAWVSTVGLGVDGIEHLARVIVRDDTEALRHAEGIVADLRGAMDDADVSDTFRLRTSDPPSWREVTVIAVRAETCGVLDELLALASPRSGLAVVVLGEVDSAGLRATLDTAGEIELDPLALRLTSIGMSHEAAANTAVLLDAAAEHLTVEDFDTHDGVAQEEVAESPAASSAVVDEVSELSGPNGVDLVAAGALLDSGGDEDEESSEEAALLVRVLGPPRLEPSPEKFSRPRECSRCSWPAWAAVRRSARRAMRPGVARGAATRPGPTCWAWSAPSWASTSARCGRQAPAPTTCT